MTRREDQDGIEVDGVTFVLPPFLLAIPAGKELDHIPLLERDLDLDAILARASWTNHGGPPSPRATLAAQRRLLTAQSNQRHSNNRFTTDLYPGCSI